MVQKPYELEHFTMQWKRMSCASENLVWTADEESANGEFLFAFHFDAVVSSRGLFKFRNEIGCRHSIMADQLQVCHPMKIVKL